MAKNTFVVNDVTYVAKSFDYNLVCDLDDIGVSLADAGSKPNSFIRGYFAMCAGVSKEEAGKLLEKHIVGGGNIEALATAMSKEMETSEFFQALQQEEKTNVGARKKAETK